MTAASEANNTAVTESAAGEVMTLAMTTEASVVANAVVVYHRRNGSHNGGYSGERELKCPRE